MSAVLAQATALKQHWPERIFGGHPEPILLSRVKYGGPYEKIHSITSKYYLMNFNGSSSKYEISIETLINHVINLCVTLVNHNEESYENICAK